MITSSNNPKIKQLRLLMEKSRLRRETGLFVVEGVRELEIALKSGFAIKELYLCPDIFRDKEKEPWFREKTRMAEEIDSVLYGKLAYRGTTEGVLAVMYAKDIKPANVRLQDPALVIVLESVEKPGSQHHQGFPGLRIQCSYPAQFFRGSLSVAHRTGYPGGSCHVPGHGMVQRMRLYETHRAGTGI